MNALVTGATGLLGREVLRAFRETSFNVAGTAFRRAGGAILKCDLTRPEQAKNMLDAVRPDIVIHAAAERRPDLCDNDEERTRLLNVEAPRLLASWTAAHRAFLIYLSTDYVFDGTRPPYRPGDPANPVNRYGRSKLAGERAVLETAAGNAAVLRVPILYGPCEDLGESAVTALCAAFRTAGASVAIDNWATRYPTFTPDVASVLRQMAERRLETPSFSGIFHWSGNEPMTKFEMARRMARKTGFDPERILPADAPPAGAPRPKDAHLDTSDLERIGIGARTPFAAGIRRVLSNR